MTDQPVYNEYDGPRSDGFLETYHRILADPSIVPPRGGHWEEFALTFNGYTFFEGENEIQDLVMEAEMRLEKDRDLSTGLSLAQLRAVLFYKQRYFNHTGGRPSGRERELIDALLDAIRLHAGADRSLDPTPQTQGERFARRVLEIAIGVRGVTHLNTLLGDFDPSAFGRLTGLVASEYGVPTSPSLEGLAGNVFEGSRPMNVSDLIHAWLPYVLGTVQDDSSDLDEEAPLVPAYSSGTDVLAAVRPDSTPVIFEPSTPPHGPSRRSKRWQVIVVVVIVVLAALVVYRRATYLNDPLHGEYCAVWQECD